MVARFSDRRGGFTLIEIMFVLLISCTVMMALGTLFVGSHRLMKQSYGVARASLDLRAEREHLLFHSAHEGGSAFWGGLLSASKLESLSSDRVRYAATGCDRSSGSVNTRSGQSYPDAGSVKPLADEISVGFSNDAIGFQDSALRRENLYAITLTRTIAVEPFKMSERVIVPIFGTKQAHYRDGDVFDDGEAD